MFKGKNFTVILMVSLLVVLLVLPVTAAELFGGNIKWEQFSGQQIRMMMNKHWFTDGIQPVVAEFEKKTGIKVIFDVYPEEAFWSKLKVELAGGQPTVDGFMVGSLDMGSYSSAGWLESLNKYTVDPRFIDQEWYDYQDLYPAALLAGVYKDQLLVLPIGTECELMAYRKDILTEKGLTVPETYDQLYDTAKKLKTEGMAGYVSRGLRGLSIVWEWTGYLLSYGGKYFDDQGNPAFNSPEAIAASEMYGKMLKDTGPEGVVNYGWPEVLAAAQQGKVAMVIEASGALPALESKESTIKGKVGYAQIPAGPNQQIVPNYWFWNLGMNPKSQKKDATFLFMMWATSKPVFQYIASESGVSGARLSVWKDPVFFEKQNKEWIDACIKGFGFVKADLVPYLNPKYPEIADIISVELQNIVLGIKSAKDAMDEAANDVSDLMKK
ncbi:MAG: sugar ABC transporter substrate-binding protein [Candidatus Atribacteria bacterium]|nr:sugar ABC transporter substrate-binding protein [Candidatus Atribacteria bacterium]